MATTKKASKKAIKKTAKKESTKVTKKVSTEKKVQNEKNESRNYLILAIILFVIFVILSVIGTIYVLNSGNEEFDQFQMNTEFQDGLVIPETLTAQDVVLTINGLPVTVEDIETTRMNLAQQNPFGQVPDSVAIEQTINVLLIQEEISRQGVSVTRTEAEEYFSMVAAQQGLSLTDFRMLVESQGMNYDDIIVNVQLQLGLENLLNLLVSEEGITVSEEEILQFYNENLNLIPENVSFEEIAPEIEAILIQEKENQLLIDLVDTLKEQANIKYNI